MATTKWEKLHEIFWANMNSAMYVCLAEQLGVTADSLRDLQIGWAPAVKFKSGKHGYGYFTIPQRDATGKVVGLALRDREGGKCCFPGSGPGCVYTINPNHRRGDRGYSAGSHNWVRTMDAKELCPVCHRPDGCLLSAENPADPKAAVCIRTTSPRKLKFGYLHILKAEGDLSGQALLAGEGLVLVVEGMSDVSAAATLGYTAIGRPSNLGGTDVVAELVRGRPMVVIGENDQKSDGKWPGRDGMIATFQTCRKSTFSAKMLMPPPTVKDLRSWIVTGGLTREEFEVHLEKKSIEEPDGTLKDNHPMTVAKAFLEDEYYANKRHLLRRWLDCWYHYDSGAGRYVATKDPVLRSAFYQWSVGKQYSQETAAGVKLESLVANTALWGNLMQAAEAHVLLNEETIPVWVNGAKGPDPKDLVVFNNGILDVPTYLDGGEGSLLDTTPDFFNTTALPHAFNPVATCPTWLSFLGSSLGDESEKADLLQEWFGYCLTPDTSLQKMMYFRGESGSGKGTILNVLQALVGATQHASSSLSQLAEPFGLAPLIGKLVCIIGDARVSKNTDAMRGLEVLLGITGNDAMQINRKFKDQLEGTVLTARITVASNDFLDVPDYNGAMLRRLNVIQFSRNFRDNPDTALPSKLAAEIEGIATWALVGLKRLREKGFTVPESSRVALQEWERDTNPIISWMSECLDLGPNLIASKLELYDCWSKWAKETHRSMWTKAIFERRLHAANQTLRDVGAGVKGVGVNLYAGRRFLGRP